MVDESIKPVEARRFQKDAAVQECFNDPENDLMLAAFRRPQRENRKRPTLFAFNTCHQCKRNQSMDDLIVCANAVDGCDFLFCYACLKKNRLVSYLQILIFLLE